MTQIHRRYDGHKLLDNCDCGGWPMFDWDRATDQIRCSCSECAEVTDWKDEKWEAMIEWNKQRRGIAAKQKEI